MYFPYLRGRQFELIAIRELLEEGLIGENIIPIIEPIKPTSTLIKTLDIFAQHERTLAFIHNPQVGNYKNELGNIKEGKVKKKLNEIVYENNILPMHIMNSNSQAEIGQLVDNGLRKEDLMIFIDNSDDIKTFQDIWIETNPKFILVPDSSEYRRTFDKNKVLCIDRFPVENRNVDYLKQVDRHFSSDHLFYKGENYEGFSDYTIVGNKFLEGGFAPYAVVIHIVYFSDDLKLRIKHFGSDSNEDYYDQAGKFYEALTKLIEWKSEADTEIDTFALREFEKHFDNGTYPGLGTIKKLCIMHHLELMSNFLSRQEQLS